MENHAGSSVIYLKLLFQAANHSQLFYKGTELEKLPVNEKSDEQNDGNTLNWSDFSEWRC